MSMYGHIVFYYIPSAWASALLILYQGQCESLTRGISKVADSRASFITRFFIINSAVTGELLYYIIMHKNGYQTKNKEKIRVVYYHEPQKTKGRIHANYNHERIGGHS